MNGQVSNAVQTAKLYGGIHMAGRHILETDRLLLREFDEDDVERFFVLCSNPDIIRFTLDPGGGARSIDHALEILRSHPMADYQKYGFGRWAVVEKASRQVIGFAGLKHQQESGEVDLGYRLVPTHWGLGFATEASRSVLDYGFAHLGLTRITAGVVPENLASVRVLQKLGFKFAKMTECQGKEVAEYVIHA